jgi:hypothetical protein
VEAQVALSTMQGVVHFKWAARAGEKHVSRLTVENVSFYPTAVDWSMADRTRLYIVGVTPFEKPVFELWQLRKLSVRVSTTGGTVFSPPQVSRTALQIDSSLNQICDIAANKFTSNGQEEVLMFDWASHSIVAVDPALGTFATKVSANTQVGTMTVLNFRTIDMREHSHFGSVLMLWRFPFYSHRSALQLDSKTGSIGALCDQDLDGNFETSFLIPGDENWPSHILYTSGEFVELR